MVKKSVVVADSIIMFRLAVVLLVLKWCAMLNVLVFGCVCVCV